MKFVRIPNMDDIWDEVRIETLSPSSFTSLSTGCKYQALLQRALSALKKKYPDLANLSLPHHKKTILGTIVHEIYENAAKGRFSSILDVSTEWERLVAEKTQMLKREYPTLRNFDLNDYNMRNKVIRNVMGQLSSSRRAVPSSSTVQVLPEYSVRCPDIGLTGKIDKLVIDHSKGMVDIYDYKTGEILDDKSCIKQEYVTQLNLYALMCVHLGMGQIRSLALIDLDGKYYDVDYFRDDESVYLTEVSETLQELNSIIDNRSFQQNARPSGTSCSLCGYRHVCKFSECDSELYRTVVGTVSSIQSSNVYKLQTSQGLCSISGLDVYEVEAPDFYLGKTLSFVNVINATQDADSANLKVTESTLVYELG